ncbi:MAG: tRNA(1)(Val) (adenine(37)-N(6))-methyltransferase, partial [Shewanella sp.]|nr:tRNA(1)(Val) (adenine(37)-N(6))-methyltransferase [Shewanella sp.]
IEGFTEEHIHLERDLFGHIICNPPYFVSGPQSCDAKRADARHTNSLTFEVLVTQIERLLHKEGKASLILPVESLLHFENALNHLALSVSRKQWVVSVRGKQPNRVLLEIGFNPVSNVEISPFIIRGKTGEYSEEMVELTKAFYLKL